MLVIGTHNGGDHLKRCVASIDTYGTAGHQVLIVDTSSDDPSHLKILDEIKQTHPDFLVETSKYGQYELGSIRHAYFEHKPERFLFIHDSVELKSKDWWLPFEFKLREYNVVPWITFNPVNFDTQDQVNFIQSTYGLTLDPSYVGIFGSMFCTSLDVMKRLEDRGWLGFACPTKIISMAMERAWPLAFRAVGASVGAVFPMRLIDGGVTIVHWIIQGHAASGVPIPCFKKTVLGRG